MIAKIHGTTRTSLYNWKDELLGREKHNVMKRPNKQPKPDEKDALEAQLFELKEQVYYQKMELDVLRKASELLKKEQGIDQKDLTSKEKTVLIDALRESYPLNLLLSITDMPKSSYFYQREVKSREDKYSGLREEVRTVFNENKSRYGYRRVHAVIRNSGKTVSEKIIRRIMREELLIVPVKKRRRYSSYKGEVSPEVENVVARDFNADKPNIKWVTDLTEFNIPAGKVFLSPIIDCYDGMAVNWTIGTSPNADLVNDMLDGAISTLQNDEKPVVHSDRGFHYRWPGWIHRMESAGLKRSMSRKACPQDNSACEGFFGTIKNEMFYNKSWRDVSIEHFVYELDKYLRWYNETRIKMSLGALSPLQYRQRLGSVV
jgi:transposase InsO family protein